MYNSLQFYATKTEGIQQLEAMIYVLDRINNDPNVSYSYIGYIQ